MHRKRKNRRLKEKKLKQKKYVGVLSTHPRGFGFVTVEGEPEDIFVPADYQSTAINGDTVELIQIPSTGKRKEGKITKIVERGQHTFVGTYQKSSDFGFVVADNPKLLSDLFIPKGRDLNALNGQKVVARITDFFKKKKPEGEIIEIIGMPEEVGTDIMSILKESGIPLEFSEKVQKQARRCPDHVLESDFNGREDVRDKLTITIDGEDAKDLDDAITLERRMDGSFLLGVHIADVSNYVQETSALDREALKRGTSIYVVDRVVPMLPVELSNGICSLNAGVDRLALSCFMEVDSEGMVYRHRIVESVIHVDYRMDYTTVNKMIQGDREAKASYPLGNMVEDMKALSDLIRSGREQRGAVDFDFPETKIVLSDTGKPIEIKAYDRNDATKLIEDFMLLANETVAREFEKRGLPFVYRTHERPDTEKIKALCTLINQFGYHLTVSDDEIKPIQLQQLLQAIKGDPKEAMISKITLRSMKQARYQTECIGHFGLAAPFYCHFTSPIRRYPDLQIHRIIKENIRRPLTKERIAHYESILPEISLKSSERERRAEELERETVKLKKVEYMEPFIGKTFTGVISGVTAFGIYVELHNTVEGLVHITSLQDDYYHFNEQTFQLIGERTGKIYELGQEITVQLEHTDRLLRTIDFILPKDEDRKKNGKRHD